MRPHSPGRRRLPVWAAALVLTVGACATPAAENAAGKAGTAAKPGGATGSSQGAKPKQPWWKLSRYSREADFKPWVYGDVRPGKGLLGNDEEGYVLYRKGDGTSADPSKPQKVRR